MAMADLHIDNRTDRELLLEVIYRINELQGDFNKISNGVGFPRCQLRMLRIEAVEKKHEEIKNSIAWWRNSTIGAMFMVIISLVIRVITWDW
jgi:hypothetical protein